MKNSIKTTCLLLTMSPSLAFAGEVSAVEVTTPAKNDLFAFSLNARTRYEFREVGVQETSHAGTLRVRPGLTISPGKNLSFLIEGEHTSAFIRDYQVGTGQSANFDPFQVNNTAISDPETNELNQLYMNYNLSESHTFKAGRQRYILDDASFVGNVGWRQNEQTIDAITLVGKAGKHSYSVAFGERVNRIFGSDATGAVEALKGEFYLLNYSYKFDNMTAGAYLYHMDFADQGDWASNKTIGGYLKFSRNDISYALNLAYQSEAGNQTDYNALYATANATKKFGNVTFKAGFEYLEDGFKTPLSTVHAFNGFADAFIGNRLGLVNTWEGLTDFYVEAATSYQDMKFKTTLHAFFDDSLSDQYGWEVDFVAIKPINKNTKILGKAAFFFGDDSGPFPADIRQASLQVDYSF